MLRKTTSSYLKVFLLCSSVGLGLVPVGARAESSNSFSYFQETTFPVKGKILDSRGDALAGVTVMIEGTSIGTQTDVQGNYTLSARTANDVLVASFIGYKSVRIPLQGKSEVLITLEEDVSKLDEVVVVGYSSRSQSELVSSVSVVKGSELRDVTSNNTANLLQGKAAGVVVSNSSGQPGATPTVRIRGTGSISAGAEPLYVVDGVIGGTANPTDIESISVLKDAAATGLYGSRAANGVIVITTKSGKAGKTRVSYSGTTGIAQATTGKFELMNGQELYNFTDKMYQNDYTGKRNTYIGELTKTNPNPTESDINAYLTSKGLPLNYNDYVSGVLPASPQNTNWQDLAFRTAKTNNHQLSLSGGTDKTRFYIGGNYYQEQGTVINTDYEQTNLRVNLDHNINPKLKITTRVNAQFSNRSDDPSDAIVDSYINMPWDNPYNPDGSVKYVDSDTEGWFGRDRNNFLFTSLYNYNKLRSQSLTGDLKLEYNILKWLTFSTTNRYTTGNTRLEYNNDSRTPNGQSVNGELSNEYGYTNSFLSSNLLTVDKSFGNHTIRGILGAESQTNYSDGINATGQGIFPGLQTLSSAATPRTLGGYKLKNNFISGFVNVDYDFSSKYFATVSFRRDGSSRFGRDNRYGNFYSFGGAWAVSNEDFFQGLSNKIHLLKIRSSYGTTGNANIDDFAAQDLYQFDVQYAGQPGGFPRRLANPNLTWEKAYTYDAGVNIGLFNRIDLAVDFYTRRNNNILQDVPLSSASGFYFQTQNIGAVRNKGVDFELTTQNIKKAFTWETSLNLNFNRNKVLELYGGQPIENNNQRIEVGRPIGSWYMRDWQGVDPANGNPLWLVQTPDGLTRSTTNLYNSATRVYTGLSNPKFTGGMRNTFAYRGFTLSAFMSYVYGNKVYNANREIFDADGAYPTYNSIRLIDGWSRWEKEGDNATHPLPVLGGNLASNKPSSRFLENGSYLRLRNVTFSYDLPTAFINKYKIGAVRVFLSGDNLVTLTKFSGMDPEVDMEDGTANAKYPISKKYLFGVNIDF
ncbi:TonB-dependent receptor [Adhaeribacter swui]|uniref:TonB-dependent receptor n=1 Tax=Adhaeribacter swui TaxID=2086471 RepID=A0A7G7G6T1_9BACT|nr:TonB-dependent receptor [Adhaeribacter swui]QNF32865.1 TonB-dependent receptor [Adhaeribacter swui]